MAQLGSFGGQIPGAQDAVSAAIEARSGGQQVPQLAQQSLAGAGEPSIPPQAPEGATAGAVSAPGVGTAPTPPDPEKVIIVKALDQRLKAISAIEKSQAGIGSNQSPQAAPVGGGSYNN